MRFLRPWLRFGARPEAMPSRPMPDEAASPERIIRHFVRGLESVVAARSGAAPMRGHLTREKP